MDHRTSVMDRITHMDDDKASLIGNIHQSSKWDYEPKATNTRELALESCELPKSQPLVYPGGIARPNVEKGHSGQTNDRFARVINWQPWPFIIYVVLCELRYFPFVCHLHHHRCKSSLCISILLYHSFSTGFTKHVLRICMCVWNVERNNEDLN